MRPNIYTHLKEGVSLVPNEAIYELLRECILILSEGRVVFVNKELRSFLGTISIEEQERFVKKLAQLKGSKIEELQALDGLPFEELKLETIVLQDNSKADFFILNSAKQHTIDAEHFHYKLLLTAEEELGFGCWNMNIKDDIIFWSNGMARIFGYSDANEVRGESNWAGFSDHIFKEDRILLSEKVDNKLANGLNRENKKTEVKILKTDGTSRLASFKTHYIERVIDGEVLSLYGTIRDITEIRKNEKIIGQQLTDLNKSNDALTEFAYTASHDLQEPLRKIEAYGNRLKSSLGEELPEKSERYLSKLISSTVRMSTLIDDILTLSRLSSANIDRDSINLNDIMKNIMSDYEESIQKTEALITYDLPIVSGIKTQFHQLFQNMVSNAIKFRHLDKAPQIDISYMTLRKAEKLAYHLDVVKKYYRIKIQDNGIGFDQKFENNIYKPFKRLVGRTEFSGTGIGLAISKKVVDNHDGFLRAESAEGQGTTFFIYLPA